MATYYDEQGNAVEAFSHEELEAKLKERQGAQTPAPQEDDKFTPLMERLQKTENALYNMNVERLADRYAGDDNEKREKFVAKFGRLTGYEETPEGLAERAKDAAKLAFESEDTGADTTGLSDVGGRSFNVKPSMAPLNDVEAELRRELGITDEDVEKYGNKQ